jgi:serine/threonine protein kinase
MSGKTDNKSRSNSDRISALGERLQENIGDEAIVAEIHVAMQSILAEGGQDEVEIREELKQRFDAGAIRPESFELVEKMLDRILLEKKRKTATPAASGVPLDKTVKIAAPVDVSPGPGVPIASPATADVPLNKTVKIVPPDNEPHDQTLKIDSSFPLELETEDKTPIYPGPNPGEDDQEFINTAVIEDNAKVSARTDDQLQVGSVIRDRFLLQEKLSGGSMGVVFKALDRRLAEAGDDNPYVAIKVLSSKLSRNANALRALQQEAAKGRCLSHPNIVRFIDLDRDDELYYIVMEWLEGQSLAEILDAAHGKNIELPMALNIVGQIGRALDYAHMRGVIHADVKPANIMITPDGHAKLLDFGIARIRQKQLEGKSKFDPAVLGMGSPAYSSMQVLTGEDPVPADDVFSLGCLLYRLVAGIRVFGPRNAADAAADGMEPQRPRGLDDGQWRALKKALSYSRVTRFPTPKEFVSALGSGAGTGKLKAKTPPAKKAPATPATPARPEPDPVLRAIRDPLPDETFLDIDDDENRRSPWRLAVIGAILVASVAVVTQTSLIDYVEQMTNSETFRSLTGNDSARPEHAGATQVMPADENIETLPMDADPEIAETGGEVVDELLIDDGVLVDDEFTDPKPEPEVDVVPVLPSFDYSAFADATLVVPLAERVEPFANEALVVEENAAPAVIELTRTTGVENDLSVVVSESGFSAARSPLAAGQYLLENDGVVTFVAGQERAQLTVTMSQNTRQEADEDAVLSVHGTANPEVALAMINVTLRDDDEAEQFPPGLLPNTFTFSLERVLVREFDPAVRLDVIRKRPDDSFIDVRFILSDISATEGQDYFAPRFDFVSFGPGQELARILIPLGQDAVIENDETFTVRLETTSASTVPDIWTTVTVIIRDDD